MLPLHYACEGGCDAQTVKLLIEAYPDAVKIRFPEPAGRRKFLDVVFYRRVDPAVVATILIAAPACGAESSSVVGQFIQSIIQQNRVDVVSQMIQHYPGFISFQDSTGRRAAAHIV